MFGSEWTDAQWHLFGYMIILLIFVFGLGVYFGWTQCKREVQSLLEQFEKPGHWREP